MPYTELTRSTKKLFLFLCPQNEFWSLINPAELTQEEIAALLGLRPTTLSHWKQSWTMGASSVRKIYQSMDRLLTTGEIQIKAHGKNGTITRYALPAENLERARELFRKFRDAYEDDTVDFYTTGKMMGMKVPECQQLIDRVIYNQAPLITGVYYADESSATEYFEKYGGTYFLWVRRGRRWLQCPLRVRYKLMINGLPTIRCKLNAPMRQPQGSETYWEYDGFLASRDNRNYWIFEKRKKAERYDHFYIITGGGYNYRKPDASEDELTHLTMHGMYLSADQNRNQDIVSDVVFVQRQDQQSEAEQIATMHSAPRVLSEEESKAVQRHYDDFNKYLDED